MSRDAEHAFLLDSFRDHLGLEAGNSPNTVESYLRDLQRFVQFAAMKRVPGPGGVSRALLRDFVFTLKDLGLAPATIRRQVSALHTYFAFLIGEGALQGFERHLLAPLAFDIQQVADVAELALQVAAHRRFVHDAGGQGSGVSVLFLDEFFDPVLVPMFSILGQQARYGR